MIGPMHWRKWLFVAVILGAIATFIPKLELRAAKPAPPPPPPPPGKVLFEVLLNPGPSYSRQDWQMNGDGSGKSLVLVPPRDESPAPSKQVYSTGRWWLFTQDFELWATNGAVLIQVTDVSPVQSNGIEEGTRVIGTPSWSNDGLDSFISVCGVYIRRDVATNTILEGIWQLEVLDVSAADLDAAAAANVQPTPLGEADLFPVIAKAQLGANLSDHHWSPDGTKVVCTFFDAGDPAETTGATDLYVVDVTSALATGIPVDPSTGVKVFNGVSSTGYGVETPRWSHASNKIALIHKARLYTVNANGSGLSQLTTISTATPVWSPNDAFLACRQTSSKGSSTYYDIVRIPNNGGTAVSLTGDINRTNPKIVLGWAP